MEKENTIIVNHKKHTISVGDSIIVKINHNKNCKKPCPITEEIIEYLKDELFIKDGYVIEGEI